jgi:hypothetical protein
LALAPVSPLSAPDSSGNGSGFIVVEKKGRGAGDGVQGGMGSEDSPSCEEDHDPGTRCSEPHLSACTCGDEPDLDREMDREGEREREREADCDRERERDDDGEMSRVFER